jgi:hypothetical protein
MINKDSIELISKYNYIVVKLFDKYNKTFPLATEFDYAGEFYDKVVNLIEFTKNEFKIECSSNKDFKIIFDKIINMINNQPKIYKGFDSIMEALLEGKKLKFKDAILCHYDDSINKKGYKKIKYIYSICDDNNFNTYGDKFRAIIAYYSDDSLEYKFDFLYYICNNYEFEEYQEKEQIKEYTIPELEKQLGHKIKIKGGD